MDRLAFHGMAQTNYLLQAKFVTVETNAPLALKHFLKTLIQYIMII